ncbi:MAG: Asp23/Gls24 family envelope stress response protein [Oscillospiraceae bacterium]|nr:Asp23/Gls24 family envelope stress response protein [Oscillospiraceae bacterium]
MIRLESHMGLIEVSQDYFDEMVGNAVKGCFGVAGMARGRRGAGLRRLQAVRIYRDGGGLSVDLRILVTYGLNISAIVRSIHARVTYTLEEATGLEVRKVNVFVDGMPREGGN